MNISILESVLARVADEGLPEAFAEPIAETALRFQITSQVRIAMFIAQAAHESQLFAKLEESLYYTTAARIATVFASRFSSVSHAERYVRQPTNLANYVYGGREGNTRPNDGWDFRGSGLFHLTFKNNFAKVRDIIGIDIVSNPELVRRNKRVAALTAGAYWHMNGLNEVADRGDFPALTRRINRAALGYNERLKLYERVLGPCGELFEVRP